MSMPAVHEFLRILSADDGQSISDEPNESEPGVKAENRFDIGSDSPIPAKKSKTKAAGSQDHASTNNIKQEHLQQQQQQMDGAFDAYFTMPGEI